MSRAERICARGSFGIVLALAANFAHAQGPGVRLDTDANPGESSSSRPQIAAGPGNTLHAVWLDYRDPQQVIRYRRGTQLGQSLDPSDVALSTIGDASAPAVATHGTSSAVVYAAWRATLPGPEERVYFRRSVDDGLSWQAEQRLGLEVSVTWEQVSEPRLAADGCGNVFVLWWGYEVNGLARGDTLYLALSHDSGSTWNTIRLAGPGRVDPGIDARSVFVDAAIVAFSDGCGELPHRQNVYVLFAYAPDVHATLHDLWFIGSNNGAQDWHHVRRLVANGVITEVELAAAASKVYAGWGEAVAPTVPGEGVVSMRVRKNSSFGAGDQWAATAIALDPAATTELAFGLDLACDPQGNAYAAYTRLRDQASFTENVPEAVVTSAEAASSSWRTLFVASQADAFPRLEGSNGEQAPLTRVQVHAAQGIAGLAWMEEQVEFEEYSDTFFRYSKNLGASWTTVVPLNDTASGTASGFPQILQRTAEAAIVWDERRFWTVPCSPLPCTQGTAHGAPESFLANLDTP